MTDRAKITKDSGKGHLLLDTSGLAVVQVKSGGFGFVSHEFKILTVSFRDEPTLRTYADQILATKDAWKIMERRYHDEFGNGHPLVTFESPAPKSVASKVNIKAADILHGEIRNINYGYDPDVGKQADELLQTGLTEKQAAIVADLLFIVWHRKGN